ncbi:MAG: hypothetical protein D6802_00210 [Ardenticatenia bacterium]|uniref:Uncharacterized protein n=1 Tax=Ardenticatena maritima TaxID=872965 RepID=A0A0M9UBH5_9CHLR|nr:hypothetical protein [Ardenticatena maritima]KPL87942.1 hypothetical protein SE16_10480 [Ardenticatena maritima]RME13912.1 MAG: hypothetical protein D6802_00210 [Ardenticatenia bacterium]GAP61837.1 hypothetical protein ARMA_0260 [Ardenticatena maritima]
MRRFWNEHPYLTAWIALSIGMVAILLYALRGVDATALQQFWMVVATIAVAGLSVWILSWEDESEDGHTNAGV